MSKEKFLEAFKGIKVKNNNVVMVFMDELEPTYTTSWGLEIQRKLKKFTVRWGFVVAVSPGCDVAVGEFVLPIMDQSQLFSCNYNGHKYWYCDEDNILIVSTDPQTTEWGEETVRV